MLPLPSEVKRNQLLGDYCELAHSLLLATENASWEEVAAICERRRLLEADLLMMWQSYPVSADERKMLGLALQHTQQAEALIRAQQDELTQQLSVVRQASRLGKTYNSV
jgi:hypothetical protein